MAPQLPVGTVTFLFSDIEGSTRLAQALGTDRWRTTLEAQQAIWRSAFAANHGTEISTEGDSFFAVFPSALDAVAAAAAGAAGDPGRDLARRRPGRRASASGSGCTPARAAWAAIATSASTSIGRPGSARPRTAARSSSRRTTRALTESSLPAGVSLVDVGRHRLKDLDQPEALGRLVIAGLEDDPRPPRSLETPTNLPDDLTSFVGREARAGRSRGRGPERSPGHADRAGRHRQDPLVAGAAAELLADFPDGVHFVQLAPISDPGPGRDDDRRRPGASARKPARMRSSSSSITWPAGRRSSSSTTSSRSSRRRHSSAG